MKYKLILDPAKGMRGRLLVNLVDSRGRMIDQEVILKHPMLLKVRIRLAMGRIYRRQKRMKAMIEAMG